MKQNKDIFDKWWYGLIAIPSIIFIFGIIVLAIFGFGRLLEKLF